MASKKELYLSLDSQSYRGGKSSILLGEESLIMSLKYLNNLRILSKQKNDIRKKLKKLLTEIISEIDNLETRIPAPEIPLISKEEKNLEKKKQKKKQKEVITKKNPLEEELKLIREKLRILNN